MKILRSIADALTPSRIKCNRHSMSSQDKCLGKATDYYQKATWDDEGTVWQRTVDYSIEDGKLIPPAPNSVRESKHNKRVQIRAQNRFNSLQQGFSTLESDNGPSDQDRREGHMVLPDLDFESHGKNSFSFSPKDGTTISSDGSTAEIHWGGETMEWNLETNTARMTFRQTERFSTHNPTTEFLYPKKVRVKETQSMRLDETGRVIRPKRELSEIRSLSDSKAAKVEGKEQDHLDRLADRVENVLASVQLWEQYISGLDGTSQDLQPKPGKVVATEIPISELPEKGVKQPAPLQSDYLYRSVSCETTEDGFVVTHDMAAESSPSLTLSRVGHIDTITVQAQKWWIDREVYTVNRETGEVQYKKES